MTTTTPLIWTCRVCRHGNEPERRTCAGCGGDRQSVLERITRDRPAGPASVCDICGDVDAPGHHGLFFCVDVATPPAGSRSTVAGFVGGVCDRCLVIAQDTASAFDRARRELAGEPPPARPAEPATIATLLTRVRRAIDVLRGRG
jgi:hypothetical protein